MTKRPKTRWKKCLCCQEKSKKLGLKDENALQGYYNNEMAKYLRTRGKRTIGWNEMLDAKRHYGQYRRAVVVRHSVGNKNEFEWMAKGGNCILSMVNYVYMGHPYNVRPLKKTYNFSAKTLGSKGREQYSGYGNSAIIRIYPRREKLDIIYLCSTGCFQRRSVCWTKAEDRNYYDFETRMESLRSYFDLSRLQDLSAKNLQRKAYP